MARSLIGTPPSGPSDAATKSVVDALNKQYAPAVALATTIDRRLVGGTVMQVPGTGRLRLSAIWLNAGTTISSISFIAGAAGASVTQRWFALYDGSRNKLRVTADSPSASWAVNTVLTLPLTSSYVVPADGLYYIGICEVATTPTAMRGYLSAAATVGIPPILSGDSNLSLTNAASAPDVAIAITPSTNLVFGFVS